MHNTKLTLNLKPMQIFFLDRNPRNCAKLLYYTDKRRAQKQLLEGIQLLNNCCLTLHIAEEFRPCTKNAKPYEKRNFPKIFQNWLLKSTGNLLWFNEFLDVLNHLLDSPKSSFPFGKKAFCNYSCVSKIYDLIPKGEITSFPNYAKNVEKGLDFTNVGSPVLAYRMYLDAQLKLKLNR